MKKISTLLLFFFPTSCFPLFLSFRVFAFFFFALLLSHFFFFVLKYMPSRFLALFVLLCTAHVNRRLSVQSSMRPETTKMVERYSCRSSQRGRRSGLGGKATAHRRSEGTLGPKKKTRRVFRCEWWYYETYAPQEGVGYSRQCPHLCVSAC